MKFMEGSATSVRSLPIFSKARRPPSQNRLVATRTGRHALKRAVLNKLFVGPAGPTACADVDDIVAGRPRVVSSWISLAGVRCHAAGAVDLPSAFASNDRIEDAVGVVGGRNIQYINSHGYPLAP